MPRTSKSSGRGTNGTGSIRKITSTKNGKTYTYWQGRYTMGIDPLTGKQKQGSVSGKTQKEVAQIQDYHVHRSPGGRSPRTDLGLRRSEGRDAHRKAAAQAGTAEGRQVLHVLDEERKEAGYRACPHGDRLVPEATQKAAGYADIRPECLGG